MNGEASGDGADDGAGEHHGDDDEHNLVRLENVFDGVDIDTVFGEAWF